jgi:epoxyqueuosine reductase
MVDNNNWVKEILSDQNIALIGFADLTEFDSDSRFELKYGISIAIALNYEIVAKIPYGPSMEYYNEYKKVSEQLKFVSNFLVEKIEERGFNAISISRKKQNENFRTPFPLKTLATRSGLGWIGRSAALITKQYGNAIRLGGILTNMPLKTGVPINSSFCGDCMECVKNCPGNAIIGNLWELHTDRDELLNAYECKKTVIDRGKIFGITEGSCGVCLAVCPWTKKYIEYSNKAEI